MLRWLLPESEAGKGISRRMWLGMMGWGALGTVAAKGEKQAKGFGKAKRVIVVFCNGGQSHIDMWDPKPDAPDGVRSEFKTIPSAVPGINVTEHLAQLAKLTDKFTILRSVSHDDLDHGSATYLSLTGVFHPRKSSNPPPSPNDYPTLGAVLKRVRPATKFPHTAIHLNAPAIVPTLPAPGQNGGFLGREFEPLVLGDVYESPVVMPSLERLPELPPVRLSARKSLLEAMDSYRFQQEKSPQYTAMSHLYDQAFELLDSPRSRAAFDLEKEPEALRRRYGLHRSGQACLLARRLAEAGVPLVTVMFNHSGRGQDKEPNTTDVYGWDTHNDIFPSLKNHLIPRFDHSVSALISDLDERGMLDDTLLICLGEFGRAPRIALEPGFAGSSPGRKHWAGAYSVLVAGAGVSRGAVFGSTDRLGSRVETNRVSPCDLAATLFWSLGLDPQAHYLDPTARPFPLSQGQPVLGLFDG